MQAEAGGASLDLRELRQVLQDEELAHKLQEEEERLLRRVDGGFRGHKRTKECILIIYSFIYLFSSFAVLFSQNSRTSPCVYPEGDFRVAQVAQDEVQLIYQRHPMISSLIGRCGIIYCVFWTRKLLTLCRSRK